MLRKLAAEIQNCYERAAECAERAKTTVDPDLRNTYVDLERRWLLLATSHEFVQQLGDITTEAKRRVVPLIPPSPDLLRVMCPECGKQMRLSTIVPHPGPGRSADILTFRCECYFAIEQTIERTGDGRASTHDDSA